MAAIGIAAVLMAVMLKTIKGEYAVYMIMAAGFLIFFYGVGKLKIIIETMAQIEAYIKTNNVYISTLMKITGITYIAEFASGICKDAGYSSIGTQIEIFGKLSILAVSMPIILALLETLKVFLV